MTKGFGSLLEVARIQSEINRLFESLLDLGGETPTGETSWTPHADILENDRELLVKIEVPGVDAQDLSLSVHGGNLVLEGHKPRPEHAGDADWHVAERSYGRFRRVIQLGAPVNTRQARAVLNNGLLRISFPRVPNRRGEPVPIAIETEP